MLAKAKNILKSLWSFVDTNTSGVPFLLWGAAGLGLVLFLFYFSDHIYVAQWKMGVVLAIAGVWFVVSDHFKKKHSTNPTVHFIFDSVFYIFLFNIIIFYTKGNENNLFFITLLPIISAPFFAGTIATLIFTAVLVFSVSFLSFFVSGKAIEHYLLGIIGLRFLFYVVLVLMVRYFAHTIEKTNKEKLTFAQKEVDEKTRELRKTFDTLREKEELLKGELSELEKYQELTVGRELKMIELKKTIKKLESQLTQKDEKNIG